MPMDELLTMVGDGTVQIPDFQRPVVLRDEWVRTLLASVSLGYPIGAVMLLPRTVDGFPFPVLPLRGAPPSDLEPDAVLVDGQHRITALFQAFKASGRVTLVGGEQRSYAFEIATALDENVDRVSAIVPAVDGDTSQFPLVEVFGERGADTRGSDMEEFERGVLSNIRSYRLPAITLDAATTLWTIRVRSGPNGLELATKYRARFRGDR